MKIVVSGKDNIQDMRYEALILENAVGEGPGILRDIILDRGWSIQTIKLFTGESIPSDWRYFNLIIVMGGPMNVYEENEYPYLITETEMIARAIHGGMPVLGFCLGAQLMAKACGAKVQKGPIREIGWYPVSLTKDGRQDPLLRRFPKTFSVFQWHGDTFEIPKKGICLIESDQYPNQAMRIGNMGYGFQFHFEITYRMIKEWLNNGKEELEAMNAVRLHERILKDSSYNLSRVHVIATLFLNKYLDLIEGQTRSQVPSENYISGFDRQVFNKTNHKLVL